MNTNHRINATLAATLAVSLALSFAEDTEAGAYVFAGDDNGVDIISHPLGYTGAGGTVYIEVCIDASATDSLLMIRPVLNILKEFNTLQPASPNLILGGSNDIAPSEIDFESLTLHELGHCIGLAHPNLATESGVASSDRDYTKTTVGADTEYDLNAGADGLKGSADDQRDDDVNLHWFEIGVNDPFQAPAQPEATTYSRDVADLPIGDDFVINADRSVSADLGYGNTEAVMQQGQFFDEDQRRLTTDDIATLRMAMTGLDETAGTADDYDIRMVYGGIRSTRGNCEIMIESNTSGLGFCSIGGQFLSGNHVQLLSPTYVYNSELNFYFNQTAKSGCSAADDDLSFDMTTHDDTQFHEACNSVAYGDGYTVDPSGVVTAVAPAISLGPGVTINGTFRAITAEP